VHENAWDLIVVDTPPSRSALDFLDAPHRLGRFLDGRMVRLLAAPARTGGRVGAKVMTASLGIVARAFTRILGGELLSDVSTFVSALESTFGGFRERAQKTYELLQQPGTAFVVVAAPEPDALREASYFVERLSNDKMPLAGAIINRTHTTVPADGLPALTAARADAAAELLADKPDVSLAESALRVHVEVAAAAEHDARMTNRFASAHGHVPIAAVPALPLDVHDLDGLRTIGKLLGA
jgi:anion-transporting  ArsA/GET3 family ATPase